jgi:hypothetical protein
MGVFLELSTQSVVPRLTHEGAPKKSLGFKSGGTLAALIRPAAFDDKTRTATKMIVPIPPNTGKRTQPTFQAPSSNPNEYGNSPRVRSIYLAGQEQPKPHMQRLPSILASGQCCDCDEDHRPSKWIIPKPHDRAPIGAHPILHLSVDA